VVNGPGDDSIFGDPLPVPEAEAEAARSAVDKMIGRLDDVILSRDSQRGARLEQWEGPARLTWDEEFSYSQLDIQSSIDALQTFKGAIDDVLEAIRAHNRSIVSTPPTGTTTTTTTVPSGGTGGGSL
jgi:hypothetical protein